MRGAAETRDRGTANDAWSAGQPHTRSGVSVNRENLSRCVQRERRRVVATSRILRRQLCAPTSTECPGEEFVRRVTSSLASVGCLMQPVVARHNPVNEVRRQADRLSPSHPVATRPRWHHRLRLQTAVLGEVTHFEFEVVVGERLLQAAAGMHHCRLECDRLWCGPWRLRRLGDCRGLVAPLSDPGMRRLRARGRCCRRTLAVPPHRKGRRPRRSGGC